MHYQLFLPGVKGSAPALLEALGLGDLVEGAEFLESPGPVDGGGALVAWRRPGETQMGFRPDLQEWSPAIPREMSADGMPRLEAGRYWIGLWRDAPPTPEQLARRYPRRGPLHTLGDGQPWRLPVARELPADLVLADDGTWKFEPQRQYHALTLAADDWFARIAAAAEHDRFAFHEIAEFLLAALRVNYRLLPEVASRLKLFTTENLFPGLLAVISRVPVDS